MQDEYQPKEGSGATTETWIGSLDVKISALDEKFAQLYARLDLSEDEDLQQKLNAFMD
jgi:hypothetical protein